MALLKLNLSVVCQKPYEQIHLVSTHIKELVSNCKLTNTHTKETLKIISLQHAIKYHEA